MESSGHGRMNMAKGGAETPLRVAVIGAGNVAGHLAAAFAGVGVLAGVWSQNAVHAEAVAKPLGVDSGSLCEVSRSCNAYVIAVRDDAIHEVSASLGDLPGIVAHTSGTVPMDDLMQPRRGVFYPLQTFSRNRDVDMSVVPFFIEGSDHRVAEELTALASKISDNVRQAGSDVRATLHLAAVFACNFANHLWVIAEDVLKNEAGCTLGVFGPLLHEALDKALECGAAVSQTGPAARGDVHTIEKHLQRLEGNTAEIYKAISQDIMHNNLK